jgi:biotin transport system substrate-specific component
MIMMGGYDPRAVRPEAATLRLAVLPRSGLLVDALLVVAGATLVALSAQVSIPLPFTPVPITGQTFAVVLVGSSLGAVLGFSSLLLYWLVGIAGAPVYAEQSHGWDTFMGPTGGYLIGFMLAALVTGFLAEKRWDRRFRSSLSAMLMGNVLIYLCGLPWLAAEINTNLEETLEAGLYPFVVGDVLKLYLAGALLPLAWSAVRRLRDRE